VSDDDLIIDFLPTVETICRKVGESDGRCSTQNTKREVAITKFSDVEGGDPAVDACQCVLAVITYRTTYDLLSITTRAENAHAHELPIDWRRERAKGGQ
jgi:hypothetical protein